MRVSLANAMAQALPLAILPITTRLYSAADFGVLAVLLALITLIGSVATFRIDWLVSTARKRIRAIALLALGSAVALGAALLVVGVIGAGLYVKIPGVDWAALGLLVWFVPIGALSSAVFALLSAWFVRRANLGPVAKSKVRQSVVSTALVVTWGLLAPGALGLAVANAANTTVGLANLSRSVGSEVVGQVRRLRFRYLVAVALRSRESALYSGVSGVINTIGLYLPNLILGFYFLPHQLGWFSVMLRVGVAPAAAVSAAVSQSLWGEISVAINGRAEGLRATFSNTASFLTKGAALLLVFCLSGPLFVRSVFGDDWAEAGWLLAALAPMVAAQFVASTMAPTITALGAVRWLFVWDCVRTGLLIAALCGASAVHASLLAVVGSYSLVMTAMYVLLFAKARSLAMALRESRAYHDD